MLKKILFILVFQFPLYVFSQNGSITGKVTDSNTGEVLPNATVFLGNATRETQTDSEGRFTLYGIKAGRYDLIVSMIGYETSSHPVAVNENKQNIDILLRKKVFELREVVIKPDPNQGRYLEEFKAAFIGTTRASLYRMAEYVATSVTSGASQTKILNPEAIRFFFDEETKDLTAFTDEFLIIENKWLGYRLNYLVTNFTKNSETGMISYEGKAYFEELKGSDSQNRRWKKNRLQAYFGSGMHFYRSLLQDQLSFNGFVPHTLVRGNNPYRPSESLITHKIEEFEQANNKDSLHYWMNKARMPRTQQHISKDTLQSRDLVKLTDLEHVYALSFTDHLLVSYNGKSERTPTISILKLAGPYALFDLNGVLLKPKSVIYEGAWTTGVGDLLPNDYMPEP